MLIKDVKDIIKDLPDDMVFCGKGHYGNMLQVYSLTKGTVAEGYFAEGKKHKALIVNMEDAGPEPD